MSPVHVLTDKSCLFWWHERTRAGGFKCCGWLQYFRMLYTTVQSVCRSPSTRPSSFWVNVLLSGTPPAMRCGCAAVNLLYFQTEPHSSSVRWMTCPEAVRPFVSWLKVKSQAQKTLCVQYHAAHTHPCWQADSQADKTCGEENYWGDRSACLMYYCLATCKDKLLNHAQLSLFRCKSARRRARLTRVSVETCPPLFRQSSLNLILSPPTADAARWYNIHSYAANFLLIFHI